MRLLQQIIDVAFENYINGKLKELDYTTNNAINNVLSLLNRGELRVAEKLNGIWITHYWLKKAIILYFYKRKKRLIKNGEMRFFDEIPIKFNNWDNKKFNDARINIVPNSLVRRGSYIASNTIIMPSFINIGAYVDEGTVIDTWSTIGFCAQIGKNVYISRGSGIGGVLYPIKNNPTIIEDNCFIGAKSEISEGVIVEKGSVISMGVLIGQNTKILDQKTGKIYYSRIPKYSVVVPGNYFTTSKCSLYCAIIINKSNDIYKNKNITNEALQK